MLPCIHLACSDQAQVTGHITPQAHCAAGEPDGQGGAALAAAAAEGRHRGPPTPSQGGVDACVPDACAASCLLQRAGAQHRGPHRSQAPQTRRAPGRPDALRLHRAAQGEWPGTSSMLPACFGRGFAMAAVWLASLAEAECQTRSARMLGFRMHCSCTELSRVVEAGSQQQIWPVLARCSLPHDVEYPPGLDCTTMVTAAGASMCPSTMHAPCRTSCSTFWLGLYACLR